jgi:hypothetical protein
MALFQHISKLGQRKSGIEIAAFSNYVWQLETRSPFFRSYLSSLVKAQSLWMTYLARVTDQRPVSTLSTSSIHSWPKLSV